MCEEVSQEGVAKVNKICGARGFVNEERDTSMQRKRGGIAGEKGTEQYDHVPQY